MRNRLQSRLGQAQAGGTLLGLIIGLIIGLGIAVTVALLITKSSSPFANKFGKSDKIDQPAVQLQDPNKPLYGSKDAVRDANKDFAREADAPKPVDNAPATATIPTTAAPDVKRDGAAVAGGKLNDKVETKPAETAIDDKWMYFLQTGAFKESSEAESARAKLALLGFEGRISERSSEGSTLYRVRVGPFAQIEALNRMRSRLTENGVEATVIRTPK